MISQRLDGLLPTARPSATISSSPEPSITITPPNHVSPWQPLVLPLSASGLVCLGLTACGMLRGMLRFRSRVINPVGQVRLGLGLYARQVTNTNPTANSNPNPRPSFS